ncbi:MAG: hypothetical protein CMJ83_01185 [Planctomycetes bacterium]|nr:hypothetical protein [Planctomycetota bacterium]
MLAALLTAVAALNPAPVATRTTWTPLSAASAPASELQGLEGAGAGVARRIVLYRTTVAPIRDLDGLRRVPGVGGRKLHLWSAAIRESGARGT